jgi:hypothetical protein
VIFERADRSKANFYNYTAFTKRTPTGNTDASISSLVYLGGSATSTFTAPCISFVVVGRTGQLGSSGTSGSSGSAGTSGSSGSTGTSGSSGSTGTSGSSGSSGQSGAAGSSGTSGSSGSTGSSGSSGQTGGAGSSGSSGSSGQTGGAGSSGSSGSSGQTGGAGSSGSSGSSGQTGGAGSSGSSGQTGGAGSSGSSGSSGQTGGAGSSGTSGTSPTLTDTLATVTARGASATAAITISREAASYGGTVQSFLVDGAAGNAALTLNAASAYAYLNFAQTGVTKFEIGAEGAATNKGSLYINHNIQVGSTGAAVYILKSNGYVGMGTIAPSYKLHVYTSDNEGIYLQGTLGGVWMNMKSASGKMWSYGAQNDGCGIYNRTDGAYTFFTKDSGLTGIGTADPGYKLHVYTNSDVWHLVVGSASGQLRFGGDTSSGAVMQAYTPAGVTRPVYIQRDGSYAVFGGTTATTYGGFTSTKVGIKQLADGGSGGGLHIEQASNESVAFFGFTGSAFRIGTSYRSTGSYQPIEFTTTAATRLYIETNGRIGIGNTSPGALLHVSGNSYIGTMTDYTAAVQIRGGFYGGPRLQVYGLDSDSNAHMGLGTDMGGGPYELSIYTSNYAGYGIIRFGRYTGAVGQYAGWTSTGQISTGGTLTMSGDIVAYGSPSDLKFKENVKPLESSLDKVLKLRGVSFTWKEDNDMYKLTQLRDDIGFIAQEVREIVPDLVREDPVEGHLSLRDRGLTALLVEAIKEQQTIIESQEQRIKDLENIFFNGRNFSE